MSVYRGMEGECMAERRITNAGVQKKQRQEECVKDGTV